MSSFIYMDDRRALPRLAELRRAFGPEAGLVDVKVVAFSATLSALKMVIPVALQPGV